MKFITQHYSKILCFVAGIVVMIIFMRSCGGKKELADYRAMKHRADSLQSLVIEKDKINNDLHVADSITKVNAARESAAAKKDVATVQDKLSASQSTINRLTQNLAYYKSLPVDSSFVKVAPGYIENCDSLGQVAHSQQLEISAHTTEVNELVKLMEYEIDIRDSTLTREKNYSAGLKAAFNAQQSVLKNALDAGRPRGRFLAGAGVIGNQTTFLSGLKVAAAYQTRGGKQYQGGAMVMNKQVYYEGTVLITLFK